MDWNGLIENGNGSRRGPDDVTSAVVTEIEDVSGLGWATNSWRVENGGSLESGGCGRLFAENVRLQERSRRGIGKV